VVVAVVVVAVVVVAARMTIQQSNTPWMHRRRELLNVL
jgi:hypothetical protein